MRRFTSRAIYVPGMLLAPAPAEVSQALDLEIIMRDDSGPALQSDPIALTLAIAPEWGSLALLAGRCVVLRATPRRRP